MKEPARKARNEQRLQECHPKFQERIKKVIDQLEAQGFRPRIQDAWRSKEDQQDAYNTGHSQLRFGYHNVTGPNGEKFALAVDMLDDDNPLRPPARYALALALAAKAHLLVTGILWTSAGQPPLNATAQALEDGNLDAKVKLGWDPCHVQVADVTLQEAERADFSNLA